MQETWVQSLGQEDPLEEEMATHSSILAGITSWTEEPGISESWAQLKRFSTAHSTFQFKWNRGCVGNPVEKDSELWSVEMKTVISNVCHGERIVETN